MDIWRLFNSFSINLLNNLNFKQVGKEIMQNSEAW